MGLQMPDDHQTQTRVQSGDTRDFFDFDDPFRLFSQWQDEAWASELNDANAMSLATVDDSGMPDVRIVLLKAVDEGGFVFYTNSQSTKGRELAANARAAICLHWKSLRRQVRARGVVTMVSDAEADDYFASRQRDSQLGAWASAQSQALESRAVFEAEIARVTEIYDGRDVPRPPHWIGYRIAPVEIEFWHDRPFRLHDRLVFRRSEPAGAWNKLRLFP